MNRGAVFLINLLQDVNVARPLAFLAHEMGYPVAFLMSHSFQARDTKGAWTGEMKSIAVALNAGLHVYDSPFAAYQLLQHGGGVLVAASESDLRGHDLTHNVFRCAPSGYIKVTLQHGFECVGFLHNRDHDRAHGRSVRFAADVICGWAEASALRSVVPSERNKLLITGPTSQLMPQVRAASQDRTKFAGLVCENLHSVRLNGHGGLKMSFMDCFTTFADDCLEQGVDLALRPHPGGRYVIKNKVELPAHVRLDQQPMYKTRLKEFAFGISAPSSVLLDMIFAGIPAAVWQDEAMTIDASNYAGVTPISSLADWRAFARDAQIRPDALLARQETFLESARLIYEPAEVRKRFSRLLSQAISSSGPARSRIWQ